MSDFAVLLVCSGNICRSPLAEQLFHASLSDLPGLSFSSAGTAALVGQKMDDRAAEFSRQHGGDPDSHAARPLTVELIRKADLVLGMAREHRRKVVQLRPIGTRTTFTIREFSRLSEGLRPTKEDLADDIRARLASTVDLTAARRGRFATPAFPEDDDVVDPYRQNDEIYAASNVQIDSAVRTISVALRHVIEL